MADDSLNVSGTKGDLSIGALPDYLTISKGIQSHKSLVLRSHGTEPDLLLRSRIVGLLVRFLSQ